MNSSSNESMEQHDLRSRTVALERQATDHHGRLSELEKWQRQTEISDARFDVKFTEMDSKLSKIDGTLSRIMWLVITSIVLGGVGFILKGGFNLP